MNTRLLNAVRLLLMAAFLLFSQAVVSAEDDSDEAAKKEGETEDKNIVRYVPLVPTFVTNYGVVEFGRLKYVRADVSVKVTSMDAQMSVQNHFPTLRNIMVMLLSRQNEGSIVSSSGREKVRNQALQEVQKFFSEEEGMPIVEDLIFTNFVVQH